MFGFKKPKPHKPQDRINPFTPSAQHGPILGTMPPDFEFCLGVMPPGFVPVQASIIVGADDDIPPEVVAVIMQALSEIPPGLIEQMLNQVIGGASSDIFRFSANDLSKGQIIEIDEDGYTVVPDSSEGE